jgi:outer membrane receptor protein involved in Fe transport
MSRDSKQRQNPFHTKAIVAGVAAAIGSGGAGLAWSAELEEVVVTARQRAESSQDIPMMVQSLSGEEMQKQGITTLEDLSRFVSGLSVQTTTPGQNIIVFRGVSDGGGFLVDPTAAIYLDEQPMSHGQASPDIYPVDISRVEALAGPQSTLFGASSQSGAVRVITNKPDPTAFEANISAGLSSTEDGGTGYEIDGTVNIPLSDSVAIRLSGFSSKDAGYIDNVLGNTVVDTIIGTGAGGGKNNSNLLEDDINDVEWQGARASVRWLVNDNWTVTATTNFQDLEADGFNDFDPIRGDLKTVKFADEYRTDEWHQTSLVIEGDLGFAQLVSATSYYDRDVFYAHDTQSYAAYFNYVYGYYYATYDFGADPVGYLTNEESNESFTQEIRLTGSSDRINWTAGIFYQDSEQYWDFYTYIDDYSSSPAFAAWSGSYPGIAPMDNWWYSYQGTEREDLAIFGELDFDITDRLTLLLGGRWYEVDRSINYGVDKPTDRAWQRPDNRQMKDDGFIPKYGLEFNISEDVMVYGVYSEGFRVGGVNRGLRGNQGGAVLPVEYDSDLVENTEFGLKSEFADGRILFNAVYYEMTWDDMQIEVTDPASSQGWAPFQIVVANVGTGDIKGFDLEFKALVTENLEVGMNFNDIQDAEVSAPSQYPDSRSETGFVDSGLAASTPLPLFADQSYSLYAEYSGIELLGGSGALRLQHSNVGKSLNQLTDGFASPRLSQGDYDVTDVIFSYQNENWGARLYVNNISDERGITYEDSQDFDQAFGQNSSNVIRPRNYGVSLRYFFN